MARVDLNVGDPATVYTGYTARKPKWMRWSSAGTLEGNAELPSGHRTLTYVSTGIATDDYYVAPVALPATDAEWRACILSWDGSYIAADGLTGFPTEGTPKVRLMENGPSRAALRIPVRRGEGNILESTFAGWSDGHAGAVERGMELTVEFRRAGTMTMVFRGMIYQLEGTDVIEITAYDRVMDLYQYSDQYQSHQGRVDEWLNKAGDDGTNYIYNATQQVGTVTACREVSKYLVDASTSFSVIGSHATEGFVLHNLPTAAGVTPIQGSTIEAVRCSIGINRITTTGTSSITVRARVILYRQSGGGFAEQASTDWQELSKIVTSGTYSENKDLEWAVNWVISGSASEYFLGMQVTVSKSGSWYGYGWRGTTTRRTTSTYYVSSDGSTWSSESSSSYLPEIGCAFTRETAVTASDVSYSGREVRVPYTAVPQPSGSYLFTIGTAVRIYLDYFILSGTTLQSIVRELILAAGLEPNLDPDIDLGDTTYYTSSTYDFLTCIQELVQAGNYGIRMAVGEPGRIDVFPRHTVEDAAVATFSAAQEPDGGEKVILSHGLTQHWMAEKATVAMLAENATESGLPLAFETDDGLMDGSLTEALQSPLRGISADATMGTHQLMASSAGGKIVQLHTNVVEGQIVLAGYRTDLWDLGGSYAGGNPVRIIIPDAGIDAVAIPTEIELGDGTTKVTLDNIRRADRSELARSMGLTADAISNNTQALPSTCWIFARVNSYGTQEGITSLSTTLQKVRCYDKDGNLLAEQTDGQYLKSADDSAGYRHYFAVFPQSAGGYAPATPIARVAFYTAGDNTGKTALLDNPKYALGGQAIHVDIRLRNA